MQKSFAAWWELNFQTAPVLLLELNAIIDSRLHTESSSSNNNEKTLPVAHTIVLFSTDVQLTNGIDAPIEERWGLCTKDYLCGGVRLMMLLVVADINKWASVPSSSSSLSLLSLVIRNKEKICQCCTAVIQTWAAPHFGTSKRNETKRYFKFIALSSFYIYV